MHTRRASTSEHKYQYSYLASSYCYICVLIHYIERKKCVERPASSSRVSVGTFALVSYEQSKRRSAKRGFARDRWGGDKDGGSSEAW
jgi:hypothetical protein